MNDEYNIDDVIPGKKSSHKQLLDQLKDMEDDTYITQSGFSSSNFFPSSLLKEQKKKDKDNYTMTEEDYNADAWFSDMLNYTGGKIDKRSKKIKNSLFENAGITGYNKKKKKKGKNKNKGELIDYKREFEPEMALYKNLLMEQNRFTDTLQKDYDRITSVKGSSRGITKQLSELIENINDARTLSMQLVEKNVNTKKLIAELNLKQKKELGNADGEGENMADFASSYLKQMLNDRQSIMAATSESSVSEYSEDELFTELSNALSLEDSDRSEDTEKYLKYENSNVEVYVVITDDDIENYEFLAKDENDNVIDDYPMPNHTPISVNRSTDIATDTSYGKKYKIIWR